LPSPSKSPIITFLALILLAKSTLVPKVIAPPTDEVLRKTAKMAPEVAATKSGLPSPSISLIATPLVLFAVTRFILGSKLIFPIPVELFLKIDT